MLAWGFQMFICKYVYIFTSYIHDCLFTSELCSLLDNLGLHFFSKHKEYIANLENIP